MLPAAQHSMAGALGLCSQEAESVLGCFCIPLEAKPAWGLANESKAVYIPVLPVMPRIWILQLPSPTLGPSGHLTPAGLGTAAHRKVKNSKKMPPSAWTSNSKNLIATPALPSWRKQLNNHQPPSCGCFCGWIQQKHTENQQGTRP